MDVKRERLDWPDIAKAACIVAVVLFHTVRQHYVQLPWRESDGTGVPIAQLWFDINDMLQPIRMPLFFAISGLMASGALQRSWLAAGAKRVLQPFYLYLLWGVLFLAFFSVGPQLESGYANLSLSSRLHLYVSGVSMAWYLWALGMFFVAARLTRSWPSWLVFGGAALLCYGSKAAYPPDFYWVYGGVARGFLYFLVGARLPDLLWRMSARGRRSDAPVAFVAFAALTALAAMTKWALAAMALEAAGIVLGIALAVEAARYPRARRIGRAIGTRTLPIYVLHFPVLALAGAAAASCVTPDLLGNGVFVALYPILLTAFVIIASLLIHRLLIAAGGSCLFVFPARLQAIAAMPLALWTARRKPA